MRKSTLQLKAFEVGSLSPVTQTEQALASAGTSAAANPASSEVKRVFRFSI
jgi:hypothetical protein